ncbi:MAG TPA: rhodanese-like domain-containing protein [Solirubrobacterales bacterium]|nr:rhodanese-like domain-containing protein [Solirubrobacterales bacterium]
MADAANAAEVKEVNRVEAQRLLDEGAQLVDVRADHEWEAGRIAGATHIPLAELPQRTGEIDSDRPVVLYCRGGNRSSMATAALADAGYDASKLTEGIVGWSGADLPLEPDGGYVAESGEAAAILQAQKKPSHS